MMHLGGEDHKRDLDAGHRTDRNGDRWKHAPNVYLEEILILAVIFLPILVNKVWCESLGPFVATTGAARQAIAWTSALMPVFFFAPLTFAAVWSVLLARQQRFGKAISVGLAIAAYPILGVVFGLMQGLADQGFQPYFLAIFAVPVLCTVLFLNWMYLLVGMAVRARAGEKKRVR
jgi:hypothetical protein